MVSKENHPPKIALFQVSELWSFTQTYLYFLGGSPIFGNLHIIIIEAGKTCLIDELYIGVFSKGLLKVKVGWNRIGYQWFILNFG